FFFQAEDGIRDFHVTGVQTCALPIYGILAETADAVISVPEVFNYWLQPGRIDVGFLGAAQLDKFGNINTTVIGSDYAHPKVRLRSEERRVGKECRSGGLGA